MADALGLARTHKICVPSRHHWHPQTQKSQNSIDKRWLLHDAPQHWHAASMRIVTCGRSTLPAHLGVSARHLVEFCLVFRIVRPFLPLSLPVVTFVDSKKAMHWYGKEKCQRLCVAFAYQGHAQTAPNSMPFLLRQSGAGPKLPQQSTTPHIFPTATLCASHHQ